MKKYNVTGMSCAACSARIEKAVGTLDGVTSVSVNLLTNSMGVEGTASDDKIIKAVQDAGYGASVAGRRGLPESQSASAASTGEASGENGKEPDGMLRDTQTPALKKRLIASVIFLVALMYLSMGHMMWNFPVPKFLDSDHVAMGMMQMLLTIVIMVINKKFFINGFKGLIRRAPNMDSLVAIGAGASFGYSLFSLFAMSGAVNAGDLTAAMQHMNGLYFESAGTILTLITVGKMLEARSKGKTTDALKELMKLAPKTAMVLRDGDFCEVGIDEVCVGDVFAVKAGDSIPVDGEIIDGSISVNEAALTGESIPVDKTVGDKVSAATINLSGYIECRALRVGEDTTLSQIIQMVSDAAASKAPAARIADKISGIFVPCVIGISVVTFIIWLIAGYDVGFAISRAIAVLVISCPCALGLATPVAIMVGNGVGARSGILFKTAAALEETARINTVVLDKTGTITNGTPVVTDVITDDKEKLLMVAGALESRSNHPLAEAVNRYVREIHTNDTLPDDFKELAGNGLIGKINGKTVFAGSRKFAEERITISDKLASAADELSGQGKTPLFFGEDDKLLGIIAVADTLKDKSAEAISRLKSMGIKVVMLTGDNQRTAQAIGRQAGVDDVIAEVLPQGKEEALRRFKESGKTAMVGDGINDAPALVRADVGIAIGAGTDVAIDAADVVLVKSRLEDVPAAIRLGRATLRNIHQNLFWAFIYNVIGIPLAAGVWYPAFGITLNPMFGAAAMSLSSFCVVTNALRLNLLKIYDTKHDTMINNKFDSIQEVQFIMKKTISIKGMMCGHCEAHVKKALEAIEGVQEAVVSHESGTAIVTLTNEVDDDTLAKAVEEEGYDVTDIK